MPFEAVALYAGALVVGAAAVWASSAAYDLAHWNEPQNQSRAIIKRGWRWARRQWRAMW